MDELLNEILKIEKAAEQKLESVTQDCMKIRENVEKEKERIKSNIRTKAEEKLKKVETVEEEKFLKEVASLEQEKELAIKRLNEIYGKNRDLWVENIVFSVVGR